MNMLYKIAAGLVAIIIAAGTACAQEFSADTESMVYDSVVTGKYYAKPGRWRLELEYEGQRQITIFRKDRGVLWQVDHARGSYAEYMLNDEDLNILGNGAIDGETRRKLLGTETIEGRLAKKYRVYFMTAVEDYLFQWVDDELKTPVRVADKRGRIITRLKNIALGSQPERLFELPEGMTRANAPQAP